MKSVRTATGARRVLNPRAQRPGWASTILLNMMAAGSAEPGEAGEAAKQVARRLHSHFVREEEIALALLGLLTPWRRGNSRQMLQEHWRWPDGFVCPKCGGREHCIVGPRKLYQCNLCRVRNAAARSLHTSPVVG